MSTYLYLRCDSHQPPIDSEHEAGQHLRDLEHIRQDVANRHAIADAIGRGMAPGGDTDLYFQESNRRFIIQHVNCDLKILDEYGRFYELVSASEDSKIVEQVAPHLPPHVVSELENSFSTAFLMFEELLKISRLDNIDDARELPDDATILTASGTTITAAVSV